VTAPIDAEGTAEIAETETALEETACASCVAKEATSRLTALTDAPVEGVLTVGVIAMTATATAREETQAGARATADVGTTATIAAIGVAIAEDHLDLTDTVAAVLLETGGIVMRVLTVAAVRERMDTDPEAKKEGGVTGGTARLEATEGVAK
jgi:hypothetical protein